MSSLLIVAAIYELVNKGNKFFTGTKLPVCTGDNVEGFQKISNSFSSSTTPIGAAKMEQYIERITSRIPNFYPKLLKDQVDSILTQYDQLKSSKFWLKKEPAYMYSCVYSPEDKKFSFVAKIFTPKSNEKGDYYQVKDMSVATEFDGFKRFSYTSSIVNNEISDATSSDVLDNADVISSIQFALIPAALTTSSDDLVTIFKPIIEASIANIDAEKYPYGVNADNAASVKTKLQGILANGFQLSAKTLYENAQDMCHK